MIDKEKAKKLLLNYNVLIKNNEEYQKVRHIITQGYVVDLTQRFGGCIINWHGEIHLEIFGSTLRGGTQESDITYWNHQYKTRQPLSVDTFLRMITPSIKYNKDSK